MDGNDAARARILKASTRLFAEEGFDAARVSRIAEEAGVNKALIYYYFKSKEAILDCIMDELFEHLQQFSLEYVQQSIVRLIEEKRLDILSDRFRFIDKTAQQEFLNGTHLYYCKLLDFVAEHSEAFRILLLESLKAGRHTDDLFRLFTALISTDESPLYCAIHAADGDFSSTPTRLINKFFFTIMPIIQFVIYRSRINERLMLDDKALEHLFLTQLDTLAASAVCGNDIMIDSI